MKTQTNLLIRNVKNLQCWSLQLRCSVCCHEHNIRLKGRVVSSWRQWGVDSHRLGSGCEVRVMEATGATEQAEACSSWEKRSSDWFTSRWVCHCQVSTFITCSLFRFPNSSHSYTAVSCACYSFALSLHLYCWNTLPYICSNESGRVLLWHQFNCRVPPCSHVVEVRGWALVGVQPMCYHVNTWFQSLAETTANVLPCGTPLLVAPRVLARLKRLGSAILVGCKFFYNILD